MRKTNKNYELEDFLFEEDRGVVRVFFVFIILNVDLLKKSEKKLPRVGEVPGEEYQFGIFFKLISFLDLSILCCV